MSSARCRHGWLLDTNSFQCPDCRAINQVAILTESCKAALAILTQNATFPADIEAAKAFLSGGLDRVAKP